MPRLIWDDKSERIFETGVSNGILFVKKDVINDGTDTDYKPGVVWNGLISVGIEHEGFEKTDLYSDNILYGRMYSPETIGCTIEAYSAPKAFNVCQGIRDYVDGVEIYQQRRIRFGLVYKTLIDDGYNSDNYLLHIVYNCTLNSVETEYDSIDDQANPIEYSFDVDVEPIRSKKYESISEIIIDSRYIPDDKLNDLLDLLLGTEDTESKLIEADDLIDLLWSGEPKEDDEPYGSSGELNAYMTGTIEKVLCSTTIEMYPVYSTFDGYSKLREVSFPVCSYIGNYAFYSCTSLTSVSFPVCSYIGSSAFYSCSSLTSVSFPVCSYIGNYAFQGCSSLTSVSFPVCSYIGSAAFRSCISLTSVSFPVCTSIGANAFQSCTNLISVSFPVCSYIGSFAFFLCSSLTTASFPACLYIGSSAFQSCASLTTVSFPVCSYIGNYAFQGCASLTTASFPVCSYIGTYAFQHCFRLTSVSFLVCSYIGSSAFLSCTRLTSVSFPVCSYIGNYAFYYCSNLSAAYFLSSSVASLVNINAFFSTPMSLSSYLGYYGSIYVPESLVSAYKSAPNWSYYSNRITAYIE